MRRRVIALLFLILAGCGVSPEERLVGVWTVDREGTVLPKVDIPGGNDQLESFLGDVHLKLVSDHTFVLSIGKVVEGTWSYAPDAVTLTPNTKGPPVIKAEISANENSLTISRPTPFGEAKVKLRKSG